MMCVLIWSTIQIENTQELFLGKKPNCIKKILLNEHYQNDFHRSHNTVVILCEWTSNWDFLTKGDATCLLGWQTGVALWGQQHNITHHCIKCSASTHEHTHGTINSSLLPSSEMWLMITSWKCILSDLVIKMINFKLSNSYRVIFYHQYV